MMGEINIILSYPREARSDGLLDNIKEETLISSICHIRKDPKVVGENEKGSLRQIIAKNVEDIDVENVFAAVQLQGDIFALSGDKRFILDAYLIKEKLVDNAKTGYSSIVANHGGKTDAISQEKYFMMFSRVRALPSDVLGGTDKQFMEFKKTKTGQNSLKLYQRMTEPDFNAAKGFGIQHVLQVARVLNKIAIDSTATSYSEVEDFETYLQSNSIGLSEGESALVEVCGSKLFFDILQYEKSRALNDPSAKVSSNSVTQLRSLSMGLGGEIGGG